jgi:TolB-like protein/Flp pilus assembly protein TadD
MLDGPESFPDEHAVRQELAKILASPQFAGSEQRKRLLSLVVDRTLQGRTDELKEYTLGVEALGRDSSFDQRLDSIVRVQATHVRRKLREYYHGPGKDDTVMVSLPAGTYVPTFKHRSSFQGELPSLPTPTIAVLPCTNLSGEEDWQYFCDGVTEEIIHELAQRSEIHVVARTSAFRFQGSWTDIRDAGPFLGADAVVECSCRRLQRSVVITARLTDAKTGLTTWSEKFSGDLADILAVQQQIAAGIVAAVRQQIVAKPTVASRRTLANPETYDLYLRARFHAAKRTEEGLRKSIALLEQVVSLDSGFALGFAALAESYLDLSIWRVLPMHDAMDKAVAAAHRALELDDSIPEAHAAIGSVTALNNWQWKQAELSFRRAIELAPSDATTKYRYGIFCLVPMARFNDAIAEIRLAARLDPLSLVIGNALALTLYYAGRYGEAEEWSNRALDLAPDLDRARSVKGAILLQQGRLAEAKAVFGKEALEDPASATLFTRNHALLCAAESRVGDTATAIKRIENLLQNTPEPNLSPFWLGIAHTSVGNLDGAFNYLEKSAEAREPWIVTLACEPLAEGLRSDRRYFDLVKRMDLGLIDSPKLN